jgi:sulfate adenylyltransferase subunit 1 (EFTu-like GTPase family)
MALGDNLIEKFFYTEINENNSEFYLFLDELVEKEKGIYRKIKKNYFETNFPKFKTIDGHTNDIYTKNILNAIEESANKVASPSLLDDIPKGFPLI